MENQRIRKKYAYRPLKDKTREIRIARLEPRLAVVGNDRHVPVLTVTNVPTRCARSGSENWPAYCALSYACGDQRITKPVLVNGGLQQVTENLRAFLEQATTDPISKRRHNKAYRVFERPRSNNGSSAGRRTMYWIDALCINQDDDEEKSHQVAHMGMIYNKAKRVVMWLGPESCDSDVAFAFLEGYARRKPRADKMERPHRFEDLDRWFNATSKVQWCLRGYWSNPISKKLVRCEAPEELYDALEALSERSYWTRAWVLREIALSTMDKTTLLCGSRILHMWRFVDAITFILRYSPESKPSSIRTHTPFYGRFRVMIARDEPEPYEPSGDSNASKSVALINNLPISSFGPNVQLNNSSLRYFKRDSLEKLGVFIDRVYESFESKHTLARYLYQSTMHGRHEATLGHDYVYSLLALAADKDTCDINPDYTMTVHNCYVQVAKYLHRELRDLAFECCQIDCTHLSALALPSWVPNWTRPRVTRAIASSPDILFSCGGDSDFESRIVGDICLVKGARIDDIVTLDAVGEVVYGFDYKPSEEVQHKYGLGIGQAALCTAVADQLITKNPPGACRLSPALDTMPREQVQAASHWKRSLEAKFDGFSVFSTRTGYLGLGPDCMKKEDVVHVFRGMRTPCILRAAGEGRWLYVGQAYVHGFMDGELMELGKKIVWQDIAIV